jgi:hypothetical protein
MTTRIAASTVLACALAVTACEKAGSKASGALDTDDSALLKDLPSGNVALMGGNYMKLQNFMQSSFGKMVRDMGAQVSGNDGTGKWMDCFAKFPKLRLLGGVALRDAGFDIRMVFTGMTASDVAGCAKDAGFKTTSDADGKYVGIEMPSAMMTVKQGYLQLADGGLYMRTGMTMLGTPSAEGASRAELEADQAKLKTGSAADDKALVELAAKADRSQTFWFAGSANGTAVADKLGEVYGAIDIDGGIKLDVTVQLKDKALADKVEKGLDQVKQMSSALPEELRGAVESIKLKRDGDHLRLSAKISEAQLKALAQMGGGMGGMGMGMGRH